MADLVNAILRVAIYIRVSTLEQAQHGYSIGEQRERLIAFCKARGWLIVEVYVDSGYSGANLDRPGIQKLVSEVARFDLVLVFKLDRLSRSQRDTLHLIEDVFLPANVDFVSMSESFDTTVPFGRAMIGILSVFAQLEREQIKERTWMGRLARAKEGLYHGGHYIPIGYDYAGSKLTVNEYEAAQVRKIYSWYMEGMSPKKIAARLRSEGYTNRYGSWSEISGHISVLRVLSSEIYLGTLKFGDVVVENAHEAIVERALFEGVRLVREKRQELWGDSAYKVKHLLVGLVFCGRCGARYFVKHNYGGYKYYTCYSRARTAPRMAKAEHCENHNWRISELDAVVEAEIHEVLFTPNYLETIIERHNAAKKKKPRPDEDILRDKIANLEKQISKLMDLFQDDAIPADVLSSRIDKLYREKLAVEEQLSVLVPPPPKRDYDIDGFLSFRSDLGLVWESAQFAERRSIIQSLVNRIVLDGEQVKYEWSFLDD